jgi:hypothetical protein
MLGVLHQQAPQGFSTTSPAQAPKAKLRALEGENGRGEGTGQVVH